MSLVDFELYGDKPVDVEKGITKDLELSESDIEKKLAAQQVLRMLEWLRNLVP